LNPTVDKVSIGTKKAGRVNQPRTLGLVKQTYIEDRLKAEKRDYTRWLPMERLSGLKWLLPNRKQLAIMAVFLLLSLLYRLLFR